MIAPMAANSNSTKDWKSFPLVAEITEQDIEAIVKEAATAIYEAAQRQQALQDDEEGVSRDDEDSGETDSDDQQIEATAFEPVRRPVPPLDPDTAIRMATDLALWHDGLMTANERDSRVMELVGFVQQNPERREETLQALRRIQSDFGYVLTDGHERPEGLVSAIQQSYDMVNQAIRQLSPDEHQRPPVLDVQ